MAYGIIGYSSASGATQPSGNIWADCSSEEVIDEGTGFFVDFDGTQVQTSAAFGTGGTLYNFPSQADNSAAFLTTIRTDSTPVAPQALSIVNDATTTHAAAIWVPPLGSNGVGSLALGKKFWAEIAISPNAAGAAVLNTSAACSGWFFGLAIKGVTTYLLKKNLVATVSATAGSNALTSGSLIGFWSHGENYLKADAVFINLPTSNSTTTTLSNMWGGGTVGTTAGGTYYLGTAATGSTTGQSGVLCVDVTNAPAITANGGTVGNMVAKTYIKFGLRWDGSTYLYGYVNGVQAFKVAAAGLLDTTSDYGVIFSAQTVGSSVVAVQNDVAFFRAAAKNY